MSSYNNSSSGAYSVLPYMGLPRSTVLLSRPVHHCRCETCTLEVRQMIESSIFDPVEPLMIPMLNTNFGWWNVRLPSKLEPIAQYANEEYISIDEDVMGFLEEKRVLNWCPGLRQLYPIRTTGDGNCLMHAVILATCGIQDSGLVLRRLVYVALVESVSNTFRKRWEKEKQRLNESIPGGLQYTSEEWDKEWTMVVNAAEDLRRTTMAYEFLEEMHVFVLANVIRRPIIILGESTVRSPLAGDSIEQNNFVGIYLPLLWESSLCDPTPVVLCYLHNHFQPLISRYKFPSEPKDLLAIPLVTSRLEPLHIHFLLPCEESMAHDLLQQYLYTFEVPRKSEDESSDEAILVAEIYYSQFYYNWESVDYANLIKIAYAQMDTQKIAHAPSKSSLNYIQPTKRECLVHRTSHDVNKPKPHAVECGHCRKKLPQKSTMTQLDSSVGMQEGSVGSSKIQFDISKGYPNKSKIYPDCSRCHAGCTKIQKDYSTGHLDNADLQFKQSKHLAGVEQDRHNITSETVSIPDNVMIFNTLKKLKSPQQAEGTAWSVSNAAEERISSGTLEKGREHGAVGGWYGSGKTDYYKSKTETQLTPSGSKTTVVPQTPASQSTKPRNTGQSQPQRRLSDISDADIEYIRQKFILKTPIYCRSLALLGKQCAKPDCNRFLASENDFCCAVHSQPPPSSPSKVIAKSSPRCTSADCLNIGVACYSGMCSKCFASWMGFGYSKRDEEELLSWPPSRYERSSSKRGKSTFLLVLPPKFKCITDGCDDNGYTDTMGMCHRCFIEAYKIAISTSKSSAPPVKMEAETSIEQSNQVKCVADDCKGLGYPAYSGLCFKCYMLLCLEPYPPQESKEPKEKAETKRAVEPLSQVQCVTEGCKGFGCSNYFGLCRTCYFQELLLTMYDIQEGSKHKEIPDSKAPVEIVKTKTQQQSIGSSSGRVVDEQETYLLTPPLSSENEKFLESGRQKALLQGDMHPLKSVEAGEVEHGQIHRFLEKTDSRAVEDNFDDWLDKKYPPKVLGDGTFSPEPPISGILPLRDKSVLQGGEEVETKARNDCTKNEESFRGGDKQLVIGKNDRESSSPKDWSSRKGKAEASKEDLDDDLPPLTTVEMSQHSILSENCGELSSDDPVPVDAVLLCSPESMESKGPWTLPSSAPDLVASGDEGSDAEELSKCLSASCGHVAMDAVAGGYCVTCWVAHSQGQTEGVSNQLVKMPTPETVVPCVMEGCRNSVAITDFGLCSACYARQRKIPSPQAYQALQSPRQKPIGSAKHSVAKETSKSSWTSSEFTRRAMRCLRPSCDRYGDPVYSGYCSICAAKFENNVMEIDSC